MKLRGSTQFYLTCALHIAPFCGTHPPTTRLGVITVKASVFTLLKGALIKESPGFLARCGRLKKPANKNPRERLSHFNL